MKKKRERESILQVRLTSREEKLIEAASKGLGLTKSAWVRLTLIAEAARQ